MLLKIPVPEINLLQSSWGRSLLANLVAALLGVGILPKFDFASILSLPDKCHFGGNNSIHSIHNVRQNQPRKIHLLVEFGMRRIWLRVESRQINAAIPRFN